MNVLHEKLKEVLSAVLPITVIVIILNFTIAPIETHLFIKFLLGALFIIIGLTIFLFGVDLGITPIGTHMGKTIAKSNKVWIVVIAGLVLGFVISIAEPDLHILANQVDAVSSGVITKFSIVVVVSVGIAVLLTTGLLRILYNVALSKLLAVLYTIIFVLAIFSSSEFLAISFDASGATTGALTVPFMLALAWGVSSMKKGGKNSEEDSFGLVGIASSGAIIAVLLMNVITRADKISGKLPEDSFISDSIFEGFLHEIPKLAKEITIALLPVLVLFLIFNFLSFKLSRKAFNKIVKGLIYTFIGLVLFLAGVNAGFMDVGSLVGLKIATLGKPWVIVLIGFVVGFFTILAEPAVHVLTHQIEDVTSGYIKRKVVLSALSIGVGFAVSLAMLKIIVPEIQLWHYLLPSYIIAIIMAQYAPKLFVGIAFDSGGVASGPMTATFILAFTQGTAEAIEHADVMIDGFGVIAMVAMAPLITLQILGFIFKRKSQKGGLEVD